MWKEAVVTKFKMILRKTTKNLSQDRRSPGQDLNVKSPEYEASANHSTTTFGDKLLKHWPVQMKSS
jgi:hypothetical protein